ncbi:D-lactate ferricytochrome c oxidoreductase [Pichia californica]|uniref:D-lactate dehydrogenase (cytochrome) n=1 Tax=Pichia californica TaxID=460514 RepID=A0A9P6WJY0_9ASCO|nr:D-lactate ferricytochrome c oxidoreductase [[Candida] californica]
MSLVSNLLKRNLNFKNFKNFKIKNFNRFNSTITKKTTLNSNKSLLPILTSLIIGTSIGGSIVYYNIIKNPPEDLFPNSSTTKLSNINEIKYGKTQDAIDEIINKLGSSKVKTSIDEIKHHSDSSWQTDHARDNEFPLAIIYPESTEDVSEIMKICHKLKVPVVPFTGGTSLEGHFISTRNGIIIDLAKLDKIIKLNADDLDIIVQPAVGWEYLRDYLNDYNLLFGPDPGPGACIGGMAATSCSGTNAARYGTMRENVISLKVVLPDGTIIKTKRRPKKSSAGYNLTNLFIGSEGTLGIITEITLKLNVKPKFENVALITFDSMAEAANSVSGFIKSGLQLNAIELLDDSLIKYVNYSNQTEIKYDEKPTLLLKIGGFSEDSASFITKSVKEIVYKNNAKSFKFASNEEEKFQLWNARKVALWSVIQYGKDKIDKDIQVWSTDVAIPTSNFVKCIEETKEELNKSGLVTSVFGHAGDGNYHTVILFKEEQRPLAIKLVKNMVDRALAADGTVSGEHGIGVGKKDFLLEEVGQDTVDLMRKIKFAIDPHKILNPDKVFAIDPVNDRTI